MEKRLYKTGTNTGLLPTGTVTFLFTDVVGSTHLARTFPDLWPTIQVRHHNLLQTAISTHHGYVIQVVGDECEAAFSTALDALAAAVAAQNSLRAADWGDAGSIHVRMGLHTGPATPRGGEYKGYLTLSHAKRILSLANGDQILLSEATQALLGEVLPRDITLRNLGKHRLKDFERGEHIYQAVAPGLPTEFAPLSSLTEPPNNLPVQMTSFVGRSKEVREARQVLSAGRLLTLTGPGGSGKTRLALQVAAKMIKHFSDGVFFVALAPVTEPRLVPLTIAQTLGIPEIPGRPPLDSLRDYLHDKSLLLLLDNFEQVVSAASIVAELLTTCRDLKVIVTSREGLHISGEREYAVPPLELPDPSQQQSPESLSQYTAVELFLQRAQAAMPDFRITNDTASVIAEICHRLDGLPLAIELAAARSRLLPPRAMLDRMEHRLEFLTGGARDLPKRQQTLRQAIAWSYDLLDEEEQHVFQRVSVFVGGCTIDAAEAVAGGPPAQTSTLDQLGSLLDKSLLREAEGADGELRFVMLETLREFGLEQLAVSGDEETVRHRHASFYLALAEQAKSGFESVEQVQWMNRMEQEHDNLRAALEWSRTAKGTPDGETPSGAEICLRLASALGFFWEARGYYSEGRERLAAILLTDAVQGRTVARAELLARSAELAYRQSDFEATSDFARESLDIFRELGDRRRMASALIKLGNAATELGDYATASKHLQEALTIWRKNGDKHGSARALISLGWVALRIGSYPLAKERLEEALAISRESGDTRSMGFELAGLGEVALRQGNYQYATQLVEESLGLRRRLGNKWGIGVSLGILGWIAMREEDWDRAMVLLGESLEGRQEIGDLSGSAWCLERMAAVVEAQGQTEKAARLLGAGAGLRASIHSVIDPSDVPAYQSKLRSLRAKLGEARFAAMWDEGRALTSEQAVRYALER